jgi:nucleoside-diphosphate-sugar epimerase
VHAISGKEITKTYDLSAPHEVRGRKADVTFARKVLGWEPEVTLEKGLAKTYKWRVMICSLEKELDARVHVVFGVSS